jgi:hypothetical protein
MRKILLTPVALYDDQETLICIAIRDPHSAVIIDRAFTPTELADKAALPLTTAQQIFAQATAASQQYQ